MNSTVRGAQPADIEEIWPRVAALIEMGLKYAGGCFGLADVRRSLDEQKRQLWVTWPDAACVLVTELADYPKKRVLHVFLVAGRLPPDWQELWRGIERWAAEQGCAGVEIRGRPGWSRRLPDYQTRMIFMCKEFAA